MKYDQRLVIDADPRGFEQGKPNDFFATQWIVVVGAGQLFFDIGGNFAIFDRDSNGWSNAIKLIAESLRRADETAGANFGKMLGSRTDNVEMPDM